MSISLILTLDSVDFCICLHSRELRNTGREYTGEAGRVEGGGFQRGRKEGKGGNRRGEGEKEQGRNTVFCWEWGDVMAESGGVTCWECGFMVVFVVDVI